MQIPPADLGVQAAAATQQHSSWGPPVAQFHAPPPNAAQQGKSGDWGSQPEAFAASQAPKGIGASGEGFEGSAFGQPAAFTPGRAHWPGSACCLWVVAEEFTGHLLPGVCCPRGSAGVVGSTARGTGGGWTHQSTAQDQGACLWKPCTGLQPAVRSVGGPLFPRG